MIQILQGDCLQLMRDIPANSVHMIFTDQHPTEKPWQLAAHFIDLHSQPGETVLDPFMGSGSTGEAAIKLGREFIGIELDQQFYDMAAKRLARVERQGDLFKAVVRHEYKSLF